jgi:hypothetical protein
MTKKNGKVKGVQLYKCTSCGKQFLGGERLDSHLLWQEYTEGKQTYQQLSEQYGCPIKTIQRRLDKVNVKTPALEKAAVVVLMDTTYFGRAFGVMLFKDAHSGKNLYKQYVKNETNSLYGAGLLFLKESGLDIKAIVCDGRKGLLALMPTVPKQMCQFHQVAIVTRYLTRKPKVQAAKELREHALLLSKTDKESFEGGLTAWHTKWEQFLNERSKDKAGKNRYTHRKLRSAHRSLKTNLPWLFTFYDNMELNIPNTTNAIDGHFADMKNKLRNHNGLSLNRKMKFIDEFLKA